MTKTNFWKDALPYLQDGAFFVLEPKMSKNGKTVRNYVMRMRYSNGDCVEGRWGQAKKDGMKKGLLKAFIFGGHQAWRINESFSGL